MRLRSPMKSGPLLLLLILVTESWCSGEWEDDYVRFNKRSLLSASSRTQGRSRSSISIPWKYLARQDSSSTSVESSEAIQPDSSSSAAIEPSSTSVEDDNIAVPQSEEEDNLSSSAESAPKLKGEATLLTRPEQSDEDTPRTHEVSPKNLIQFSYYPITQHATPQGQIVYEIEDSDLRTSRQGWGWGKGKKKKCKKGKKKGKGKKKKGGKKKGKKGCAIKGGWWYVWDKKHGYLAGRWGDPPPKGLEREHYHHNFGKLGHSYGQGYDGHGHMGWKVNKGWGHGGGGGSIGGYGGGYGGPHHHHQQQHGWGHPVEYYGWGWAEKQKGWGWRR